MMMNHVEKLKKAAFGVDKVFCLGVKREKDPYSCGYVRIFINDL
jgi:hypothetical protein